MEEPLKDSEIILGACHTRRHVEILSFIFIIAKKYIHDSKLKQLQVSFLALLHVLKNELPIEQMIRLQQDQINCFNKKLKWLDDQI